MVGVDGYTNDTHSTELIENYHVGGFIVLGENVKDTQQVLNLVNSLKRTNAGQQAIPLFIGIDEEGGRITRMPPGFVRIPTNKTIGWVNDSDFSYRVGSLLGERVKSFGFNIDFAPVLDINSNPKNPVIGDRSFSANPQTVTQLGIQTLHGMQSQDVIPVIKHFPGHGDTSVDSHVGLPVVNKDLPTLRNFELIPFREAINDKAEVVMIAHILLPKIDKENPASMSQTVISQILRKELGFSGVVITDDMTMGAIVENYDITKAAVKSVNAGSDIILVCHNFEKETAVIQALRQAVKDNVISESTVDNSVYRILALKQKYGLKDGQITSIDVQKINSDTKDVLGQYLK